MCFYVAKEKMFLSNITVAAEALPDFTPSVINVHHSCFRSLQTFSLYANKFD